MNISTRTLLCGFLLLSGCSSSEPSRYAVSGKVTMDGKPASLVTVNFIPGDPDSTNRGSGPTDPNGVFKIGEDGKNSGLPAGEYKVSFSQTLINGKPTLAGSGGKAEEKVKTEREAVADEFRDPKTSPVTATIGSGTNEFTFEIKSKK
ncbi:MAG: hypothetical protein ACKO85_02895 [Isosphaeraceae bacterium]